MTLVAAFLCSLLRSLGFLTRLPVDKKYYDRAGDGSSDAGLYPLAGGLIGCVGAAIFALAFQLDFSPLVASLLAVAALITITGGLHEDGLSDVADAFFAPKACEPQARLAIMKDSHIGVFGLLALMLTVGLRVVLLADLAGHGGLMVAALTLIMAEGVSRAAMVVLWSSLPNVREKSIARSIGTPDIGDALKAFLVGFFLLLILSFLWANFMLPVVVIPWLGIVLLLFRALCRRKIGGLCGDVLGAAQQISIIAIMLACVAVF